ncbi:MAG: HD domain-containing protein [Gemmiger sp.]|nr:HD domain-containing protein [Gemmiger sp.]
MPSFQLTHLEQRRFRSILRGWADQPQTLRMQEFIQHGRVTTYAHCMRVAQTSFWLNRHLCLHGDETSLVRGAFLHDFYLYDWHHCADLPGLHGFEHPARALKKARQYFDLNPTECNIIATHMWPLTLTHLPRCREAAIVCMADKLCSLQETFFKR